MIVQELELASCGVIVQHISDYTLGTPNGPIHDMFQLCTLASEQEHHHQMQFNVILRIHFFLGVITPCVI